MKNKIIGFLLLLLPFFSFGQIKFEPTILILAPNKILYDKSFNEELAEYNNDISKKPSSEEIENYLSSNEFLSQTENIQKMIKSEIEFSNNINFFKNVSLISEQFLAYRFFEKFSNLLIILKDQTSVGSVSDLKNISEKEKLQYVLNFSKIELYKKDNISYSKIDIQLYDNISKSILLDKSYIGDWHNPGFEFSCKNQSINCTINNALSIALSEILYAIASNNPTLIREKQLSRERFNVLTKEYLIKDFDKIFLKPILKDNDKKPFQLLLNSDKSKFVVFFIEEVSKQNLSDLNKNKEDKNIQIISPHDIKDKEYLDEIPRTYAYIIKGVNYNDTWYYEKSNATYFQANTLAIGKETYFNNLQRWNFFKENSTEHNTDFWETNLFTKVESAVSKNKSEIEELKLYIAEAKSDEDKEFYQGMIDDYYEEDLQNKEYFGLYEIVVDKLKQEK